MTTDDVRKELNRIDERTHRKLVHYIQTTCCPEDVAEECVQYAYLQALFPKAPCGEENCAWLKRQER